MSEQLPDPMPENSEDQKRVKNDLLEMAAMPDKLSDQKSVEAHMSEMGDRVKANESFIEAELKKGRTAKSVLGEIGEGQSKRLIGEDKVQDLLESDIEFEKKMGDPMPDDPAAKKEVKGLLKEMRHREVQKEIQAVEIESVSRAVKAGRPPEEILNGLGGYDEAVEIIGKDFADELIEMIEDGDHNAYPKDADSEKGED